VTLDWFGLDGDAVGDLDGLVAELAAASGVPPCRWSAGVDVEWLNGAQLSVESGTLTLELGDVDVTAVLLRRVGPSVVERLARLTESCVAPPVALYGLWQAYVEDAKDSLEEDVVGGENPRDMRIFSDY
jgi:hypothetical protein